MPLSKDLRFGPGVFNFNVSCFYEYLADQDEEIQILGADETEREYHKNLLEEEMERLVNKFISYYIFNESEDPSSDEEKALDLFKGDVWGFVDHRIVCFLRDNPTRYLPRSTIKDE